MTGPTDAELGATIATATGERVDLLGRRPYEYATSAALEELTVRTDGSERRLIVKHLGWDGLIGDARSSKQQWLHDPRRELSAYRALAADDVTPRFYGGVAGATPDADGWVVIDKVDGVELWQIGDIAVWRAVASWLAQFHDRFADAVDAMRADNPHLVVYDGSWIATWIERGVAAVERSGDSRAGALQAVLDHRDETAAEWAALPVRFVHGELYPSNVLVGPGLTPSAANVDVRPIDWEMTGIGPATLDLAALSGGWGADERDALIAAYVGAGQGQLGDVHRAVDLARLHLALRWLGWADGWNPPAEHASDWVGEALSAAADLGYR